VALLVAATVALAWVNSPWQDAYEDLWSTDAGLNVGGFELREDLRHWVNDGLMVLFFFVVGLEIKTELVPASWPTPDVRRCPSPPRPGGWQFPLWSTERSTPREVPWRGGGCPSPPT